MIATKHNSLEASYRSLLFGFYLRDELAVEKSDTMRASKDDSSPWRAYYRILLSCRNGDFSSLSQLIPLMKKSPGDLIWTASAMLAGWAGSWDFILSFDHDFRAFHRGEEAVVPYLTTTYGASCRLEAVKSLIALHQVASDSSDRSDIEKEISFLLESENGDIWWGAKEEQEFEFVGDELVGRTLVDRASYYSTVERRLAQVEISVGKKSASVLDGGLLDMNALIRRIDQSLARVDVHQDRLYRQRLALEATTGVNCTGFFDKDLNLLPIGAAAVVESLLESGELNEFIPGQRYFFGHPIPL